MRRGRFFAAAACAVTLSASTSFAISLTNGAFGAKFTDTTFADYNYTLTTNGALGQHPSQVGDPSWNVWGVFSLTGIHALTDNNPEYNNLAGNAYYNSGSDGKYYVGVYGGMTVDFATSVFGNGGHINLTNAVDQTAYLKIYEVTSATAYDDAVALGPNASGKGAFNTFATNLTSGTLWLDTVFSFGTLQYYSDTAAVSDVESIAVTDSKTSRAEAYLTIVGGTAAPYFETGVFPSDFPGAPYRADLKVISDLTSQIHLARDPVTHYPIPGKYVWNDGSTWTTNSQDPITGNVVPEPGTMVLLGSGLLGLAGTARRRLKKTSR